MKPGFKEAWYYRGLALEKFRKFNDAKKCYEKALEIDSNYKEAREALEKIARNKS